MEDVQAAMMDSILLRQFVSLIVVHQAIPIAPNSQIEFVLNAQEDTIF